ncbi:quinol:cytochrome c oxidoreductase iron-sulfur protein precursor [Kordia periserrulae]|uniref:Quinol:cytochrome c oxidoreductase iron-sulfur protein n=1 Tax=Kordia periserrulae TaxID=701523 RepID=A0A2T6C6D5_9FLAO|nr:TAT-variant-translocated molybdopterin oxidoreductase [Kordia periserrulae]PTX63857.1 quinol:cytochrome c oxidoreductase iron-sulfur protein precursor [Kordia periserrulae]
MASNKKYWKSVEELNENSSIVETLRQNEFVEEVPVDEFLGDKETLESSSTSRRDFLKYVGFSTAAATLAACEGPVVKSIPYVIQPETIIPGVADYYATTIADGYDFASILIKTREGRPIKVENNKEAITKGSANARVHASVLSLYDSMRVKKPKIDGKDTTWETFDAEVGQKLNQISASGKQIVLLTQTFASPSVAKLVGEFTAKFGNVKHVVYDAVSESAALDAFEAKYGERGLADYDFSKAEVIVSVGADFLGDWQGGGYDDGYAKGRIPHGTKGHKKMSRHVQFESNMTLSGANADKRVPLTVADQKVALAKLYAEITGTSVSGRKLAANVEQAIKNAAGQLKQAGSKAVVVTGINDVDAQSLVLAINEALASKAFDTSAPRKLRQGSDKAVAKLISDMKAGAVGGIIMAGVNPVYTLANGDEFAEGLKKLDLAVTFTQKDDETAITTKYVAAAPHYLESWGDVEIKKGHYGITQPTIRPLFDTRQFQDALLKWTGNDKSYYEYLRATWTADILGGTSWNQAVHDGVFKTTATVSLAAEATAAMEDADAEATNETETETVVTSSAAAQAQKLASTAAASGMELVLYTKTGMGDGQQANNPWLQEFPDPITRASWDNYLTVSQADAEAKGLKNWNVANGGLNGSYANITVNGSEPIKVPVIIQPGQAPGTVGLALGYGKTAGIKKEMQTGVNAYKVYQNFNNVQNVSVEAVGGEHEFACVQLHNTLMGRGDIVKETTLEVFNTEHYREWNPMPHVSRDHEMIDATSPKADMWAEFDRSVGHHFNLSIDLNACTGCGACVIACHAENNVPVVGKTEVRRSRDMHWLRIDRYYSSADTFSGDVEKKENMSGLFGENGSLGGFLEMESPAANPQVAFQPVMCQHCNHAPCETVCPVAATSHGRQGQNHMAYNRCVGTRYCANNCPYKVRRFNWFLYNKNDEFDYHMNDDLGRMVLNPDVVVRSRGVMEKCSMCIQKTQKTILDAKREGRQIKDGEFQTACSAACSSGAMVFGDLNDKESKVAELHEDERMYHLLEHVGTKPNVQYHVKVRNTKEA